MVLFILYKIMIIKTVVFHFIFIFKNDDNYFDDIFYVTYYVNHISQFLISVHSILKMIGSDPQQNVFNEFVALMQQKQFGEADKMLVSYPSLANHVDESKRRAVHYAAGTGHLELVQRELTKNPQLAHAPDDTGWSLLMISASAGYLEIVRYLLDNHRVDVNHRNDTGQSSLHYACSKGNLPIAQALIDHGADLNAQDERGATALHRASSKGNQRIVNLLMGYRTKMVIGLADQEGNTALHLACEDDQQDIALLLVRCGANAEQKNRADKTPLDLANGEFSRKLAKLWESIKPTAGT